MKKIRIFMRLFTMTGNCLVLLNTEDVATTCVGILCKHPNHVTTYLVQPCVPCGYPLQAP